MTNANRGATLANTDDTTILGGQVRLLQPKEGLRAGLDAVMAAAAVPAQAGNQILDLGCGTGAAGFCVLARVPKISRLMGFDIQPALIECAKENARINGWESLCQFFAEDLREASVVPTGYFDHALCNPPYMQQGAWYETPDPARRKALGKVAGDATLTDWIDCLHRALKSGGTLSMIHRADHADKIIQALGSRFGALEIWSLHPHAGEKANRIVLRAQKGCKTPAVIHAGIVLHEQNGAWTGQAKAILENAAPLG